jgi:hypothetical protein
VLVLVLVLPPVPAAANKIKPKPKNNSLVSKWQVQNTQRTNCLSKPGCAGALPPPLVGVPASLTCHCRTYMPLPCAPGEAHLATNYLLIVAKTYPFGVQTSESFRTSRQCFRRDGLHSLS